MSGGRSPSGRRGALAPIGRRQPTLSDDPVERAAAEIRHITRVSTLELALNVGEIVFRHIFRGDLELLRRNGPKDVSFGLLAQRQDLGLSRATLWRSVGIYELSLRLPQIRESRYLGVSHVRAVLGLPTHLQEQLLSRAELEELEVADLVAEASRLRKHQGGRPRKLDVLRAIDNLMRVAAVPLSAFRDPRAMTQLTAEDVECTSTMLQELDERLAQLRKLLKDAERRR